VVSFTLWLLYPQRKSLQYPLDRGLCGPQAGLDTMGKRKCNELNSGHFYFIHTQLNEPSVIEACDIACVGCGGKTRFGYYSAVIFYFLVYIVLCMSDYRQGLGW
jgi:hypothetical protein